MSTKSKFFKVCQAGKTVDDRIITPEHIQQMADNYNPKLYGARVWCEHYRSVLPEGIFPALGDVLELKAEKDEEGNLSLYAMIEPTEQLKQINEKRQKLYTSIELQSDFPSVDGAYLVGLAVTDSPASLGTEMLKFSLTNKENLSENGKKALKNIYSASIENQPFEFIDSEEKDSFKIKINKIASKFKKHQSSSNQDLSEIKDVVTELAETVSFAFSEQENTLEILSNENKLLKEKYSNLENKFNKLEDEPSDSYVERTEADGRDTLNLTDC